MVQHKGNGIIDIICLSNWVELEYFVWSVFALSPKAAEAIVFISDGLTYFVISFVRLRHEGVQLMLVSHTQRHWIWVYHIAIFANARIPIDTKAILCQHMMWRYSLPHRFLSHC